MQNARVGVLIRFFQRFLPEKVLIKVTVRCGCDSEIEGLQLVREKFKVVVNQSSTIGNLAS